MKLFVDHSYKFNSGFFIFFFSFKAPYNDWGIVYTFTKIFLHKIITRVKLLYASLFLEQSSPPRSP
jgi:hypothetical protein